MKRKCSGVCIALGVLARCYSCHPSFSSLCTQKWSGSPIPDERGRMLLQNCFNVGSLIKSECTSGNAIHPQCMTDLLSTDGIGPIA